MEVNTHSTARSRSTFPPFFYPSRAQRRCSLVFNSLTAFWLRWSSAEVRSCNWHAVLPWISIFIFRITPHACCNLQSRGEKVLFLLPFFLSLYYSISLLQSFPAFTIGNQRVILIGSESRRCLMRSRGHVGKETTGGASVSRAAAGEAPLFLPAVGPG